MWWCTTSNALLGSILGSHNSSQATNCNIIYIITPRISLANTGNISLCGQISGCLANKID